MPESPTVQGIEMFRKGRISRARECFKKALEEHPDNAIALSFTGVMDAIEGRDLPDCEERCFRAVMAAHGNAQLHANLAWVQLLSDRRRAAVESVTQALEIDPGNADARRIQARLGRRQPPPISSLTRQSAVNRTLGKLTHRIRTQEA